MVKNPPAVLESREPQETQVQSLDRDDPLEQGRGSPLQGSCLENPRDRGAWWATVRGVTKSLTWPKRLSTAHMPMVLLKEMVFELGLREELLFPSEGN